MPPKKATIEIRPDHHPNNIPIVDNGRVKFTKWHRGSKKYYRGNDKETIWNQDLFRRGLLESEQRYLTEIHNGTHKSIAMYPGFGPDTFQPPRSATSTPLGMWGRSATPEYAKPERPPPPHVSALRHLKTFNSTLSAGLGSLKESLQSTNRGLDTCLATWHQRDRHRSQRRPPRPRSSMY